MADIANLYKAASQLFQQYDIDKIVQKEELQNLKKLLAERLDIKADAKESLQKGEGINVQGKLRGKLKTKAKALVKRLTKTKKAKEAKEVEEVEEVEEREEKSLDDSITELKETKERDAKLNRLEIARHLIEMAEKQSTPEDIIKYLINPIGPYGKRPAEAYEAVQIAQKELTRRQNAMKIEIKKLTNDEDINVAKQDLDRIENLQTILSSSLTQLSEHIDGEIGSQALGNPTWRIVAYKSKIKENVVTKIPLFKDENELKAALRELDNLTDPTSHYQWCSKYDYEQIVSLFSIYAREASEILNSQATNIPHGLLNNRIKVLQNNTSYKFVNMIFENQMIVVIKESDRQGAFAKTEGNIK